MYNALFVPKMKVPAEVLDPWKEEMTGKANLFHREDPPLDLREVPPLDLWVPVSRHKE
jgi:hypothetical protein